MELDELTLATFEPRVGDAFRLDATPAIVELVLESATAAGERADGRDPFSLVFSGPPQPLLTQATYRLEHADLGALEIFIVPIGQDAVSTRYEAIFT